MLLPGPLPDLMQELHGDLVAVDRVRSIPVASGAQIDCHAIFFGQLPVRSPEDMMLFDVTYISAQVADRMIILNNAFHNPPVLP